MPGYRLPLISMSMRIATSTPNKKCCAESGLVASVASGLRLAHFMAVQAAIHRRGARDFRHRHHLANLSVARLAFYPCLQMRAVVPRDTRQNGVYANPRNGFL